MEFAQAYSARHQTVTFQCGPTILRSIAIQRFFIQKIRSRPITDQNISEDRFFALSARRSRRITVPQLGSDQKEGKDREGRSGRRISARMVQVPSLCMYLCKAISCVCSSQRTTENGRCMFVKKALLLDQAAWNFLLFKNESRFTLVRVLRRLLIWRKKHSRYHQCNTVETHRSSTWW